MGCLSIGWGAPNVGARIRWKPVVALVVKGFTGSRIKELEAD